MGKNKKRRRGQGGSSSSCQGSTKRAMPPNNGEPSMQPGMKTLLQTMVSMQKQTTESVESMQKQTTESMESMQKRLESIQTAVAPLASELIEVKRVNDELRKDVDGMKETLEKNKKELEELKQARSQPNRPEQPMVSAEPPMKTPSYRFEFTSKVNDKVYTRTKIGTDKNGSIEGDLLCGGKQLEPDDPFSSIWAQLFLLEGDFKGVDKQDWDEGYFLRKIITPGSGKSKTDMDIEDKSIRTFQLTNGIFSLSDLQIKNNSNRKDIRLGVRAATTTEERIVEGISNPFKVQECKTISKCVPGLPPFRVYSSKTISSNFPSPFKSLREQILSASADSLRKGFKQWISLEKDSLSNPYTNCLEGILLEIVENKWNEYEEENRERNGMMENC